MEDAATAEISRAQIWQWIHRGGAGSTTGGSIDCRTCSRTVLEVETADLRPAAASPRRSTSSAA